MLLQDESTAGAAVEGGGGGSAAAGGTTSWAESLLDQTNSWILPMCLLITCWVYIMPIINKILKTKIFSSPRKIEHEPAPKRSLDNKKSS